MFHLNSGFIRKVEGAAALAALYDGSVSVAYVPERLLAV